MVAAVPAARKRAALQRCDPISFYTFTFGDGSPAVTQNTAKINHTYSNKGTYNARATVKDPEGIARTNTAQQTISVAGGTRATPTPTPTPSATPTPTPKRNRTSLN